MMKTRRSLTALLAAAGVLALVACSSTKKPGEDPQRSSSADGLGTADQPNGCGTYVGDAELPEQHGGMAPIFTGHLTESSLKQNGRFYDPLTPWDNDGWSTHSCATPNPKSPTTDLAYDVRYDELFFKNWTDADACISVFGHPSAPGTVAATFQIAAYVGGFEPGLIEFHNVGVGGGNGTAGAHYSFKVPAHADFEIVVSAEAPYTSAGIKTADVDVHWQLQVANCGVAGSGGGTSSGGSTSSGGTTSSSGGTSSGDNGGNTSSSSSSSSSGSSGDDAGTGSGKTW